MRPHPFRRSTDDVAAKPQWQREEASLIAQARGDASLLAVMRSAQTAEPADLQALREQLLTPLAHARMVAGGASVLPELERALILALIDKAIKVCEEFSV